MRRRTVLAAALAGASRVRAGGGDGDGFTDLMPAFWRVVDATRALPAAERAQRLVHEFFDAHAAVYRRTGRKTAPAADEVGRWLAWLDANVAAVRLQDARFADGHRANLARFRAALPDFDGRASPVFLLPSIRRFDAHLEPDGATLPLFFGPDGIVAYHGAEPDLGVLFAHELFHCYQGQRNPALALDPKAPVHASLWGEGTATFASERLNPGASRRHVLLDDAVLGRDGPATAARAAGALLERLDATDDASQEMFFSTGWQGDGWPARAGYYVGWRIATRWAAEGMTMPEMASMPPARVRDRLAVALKALRDDAA